MPSPFFIGIDWGSTHARAMLFAPDATLVAQRQFPLGLKQVAAGRFRDSFHQMTDDWRGRHGPVPAILSGMVGSRHGWLEAPYLACPASVHDLARHLVPVPDEPAVFIVPGLKMPGARPDVMRGEELQVLGLRATGATETLVCIPGTHAKWIVSDGDCVREFHTAMTGELYAAVTAHTLLAPLLASGDGAPAWREAAFLAGIERSAAPHGLLHALFELRAGALLGQIAPDDLADALSGLLLGTEIRHARTLWPAHAREIALLGAAGVGPRYERALAELGFHARPFDVQAVTAAGFAALARAAGFAG